MRPTKKLVLPMSHCSSNASLMVSCMGLDVVQLRVGVVPVRNERIDLMRISLMSG